MATEPVTTDTRTALLDAAEDCLRSTGHRGLSTRAVAERAGMPLSQIHYHFGGKEGLLLGVLERQNRKLLARQHSMYGREEPLWRRWEQACDFLERDLESGYVRILQEMIAVGWSDPAVAASVLAQLQGWVDLLEGVAREAVETLGITGLSARHIALLVGCAFAGAEEMELLGFGERGEVPAALRALGAVIRAAEEAGGREGR